MTKTGRKSKSYVGVRFNSLVVTEDEAPRNIGNNGRKVTAVCDCGNAIEVFLNNLKQDKTISCGCARKRLAPQAQHSTLGEYEALPKRPPSHARLPLPAPRQSNVVVF